MERRIDEFEQRLRALEDRWAKVAYWFTDRPDLNDYVPPSVAMFRAYLDGLESEGESPEPFQEPPAGTR